MTEGVLPLLIGGQHIFANSGKTFDRLNPITGKLATKASAASVEDANNIAQIADEAFKTWSQLGPNARRTILLNVANEFDALAPQFIQAMKDEIGATSAWAGFNVMLAGNMIREAASLTTQITGETIPSDKPGCVAIAVRQPCGVVLGIAPWNAPVILGVRAVALPIACGNSAILKCAEACPRTHWLIGEAFKRGGLPDGVLNIIMNAPEDAPEIVGALIDHKAIKRVNFTGSTHVGRIIAQRAAKNLKPALLELGGKAPLLVLKDADIDEAVKAASFGAFMNQGQICMSTERIIVVDDVYDEFVEKFAIKARKMPAGGEGNTPLGSVVDIASGDKVRGLMKNAIENGAKLIAGGNGEGVLIPASVLEGVTPAMKIYSEESFGPVVSIVRAKDTSDAVRIANDTEYGLTASIFTKNIAEAFSVAAQIQSGMCHINGATVHDEAQMPFGGVKDSGYGRFGGQAGIAEFTDLRWITIETRAGHYPI
ncbi:MAG: aldehyde dehydrogenase [Caulobacterales bacterium]|nr:aldehyde dehydrogenase [Caulobacterales bacterium]